MNQTTDREKGIYRVTIVGGVVNLLLLVLKFVTGIISHSAAMVADAVHSLSDFVTDIVVVIFVRISSKKEDDDHHYGHGKFETLATVIIGVVLGFVGIGILREGIGSIIRALHGEVLPAPGIAALIAAIVSIVSKEWLYRYTVRKGKQYDSSSVMANAWHHRSDAFSSIGTAIGIGGAILLGERWRILDPIAAVVVSIFILKVAFDLAKSGLDELLEKSLPKATIEEIRRIILSVEGVSAPHHLRTRRIGNNIAIEIHIRMDGTMSLKAAHDITKKIESAVKEEFGQETHIGIHMEPKKR
jgi:cation diffusion facilitator family transporter